MNLRKYLSRLCVCLFVCAAWTLVWSSPAPEGYALAAGMIRGVGTMGRGAPATPSRPGSSFGNTPGDYRRGYEGTRPGLDPWRREADFKARNYELRHNPPPSYAAPPPSYAAPPPGGAGASPHSPSRPKPPLPGDRDMPADSPAPLFR